MYCKHCGHEVNEKAIICPNCGIATDNYKAVSKPTEQPKTNGFAIAGMICAIFGVIGGDYLICLPSLVGIILSIVGMVKVKEYKSGYGCALSGIIIGAVSFFIWSIVWGFIGSLWFDILFRW